MMRWTPPADGIEVPAWKWCATTTKAGDVRMQITTVGLDIAKNLFQLHGADAQGRVLLKRKLARGKVLEFFATLPACLVGLEACGAAPYWARELTRLGHQVRLMPPQYVRPYVKTNKHDAADAEIQHRGRHRHLRVAHRVFPRSVSQRPGVNPFVARLHRFWLRTGPGRQGDQW